MNRIEISDAELLPFDLEGVGRCNLLKLMLLLSELIKMHPTISVNSAGLYQPKSGRTTIHSDVVKVAQARLGTDISNWPITLMTPEKITNRTIAICLCDPELIHPYILARAYDVLLAPIRDPFGVNIQSRLEVSVSQIANIDWLIHIALTQRFDELGISRDGAGNVVPRYLNQFEPRGIESEYRLSGFLDAFGYIKY